MTVSERTQRVEKLNQRRDAIDPGLSPDGLAAKKAAKEAEKEAEFADAQLLIMTMTLITLFWKCMYYFVMNFNDDECGDLLLVVIDWVADIRKHNSFITNVVIYAMRKLIRLLPFKQIRGFLAYWCTHFGERDPDGLPSNASLRAMVPRLKNWVEDMDQAKLQQILAFFKAHGIAIFEFPDGPGRPQQPQQPRQAQQPHQLKKSRRRYKWPKGARFTKTQRPASNSSTIYCIRKWNEGYGSSSMKGTKRKTIISLECGRVYKKSKYH